MGLGKTIQTIAFIDQLIEKQLIQNGLFLIVVPLSTLKNWENEIKKWSKLKVEVLYGENAEERRNELERIKQVEEMNIILTTYSVLKIETKFLTSIEWAMIIFDEGHQLKSNTSQITKDAKKLITDFKLILTGTPIMNEIDDIYNLLDFLNPNTLDEELFELVDESKKIEQLENIKPIINPYILRRTKKDVEIKLPPKTEIIVEVELTNQQKTLYKAIYEKKLSFLRQKFQKKIGYQLISSLKNICNHPYLLDKSVEETIISEMKKDESTEEDIMIHCSSKLVLVDKILTKIKKEGQKTLIFSQQLEMLTILEDYLIYKKFGYVRLDGGTSSKERNENIEKFNNDMDCFVFLLSPLAGGLGINLISANNVILYDSSFNPFIDQQAIARCHRFGQTRTVTIFRLVTKNTYEKYILQKAGKKLVQGNYLLDSEDKIPKEELENLLKLGAYHIFLDDESIAKKKDKDLLQDDIENIISKSKIIITESQHETKDSQLENLYFAPTEEDKQIDLNDEKFWEKILPTGFIDVETLMKMVNDSSLKIKEKRDEFVTKVKESVNNFLQQKSNEKYHIETKDKYWQLLYKSKENSEIKGDKENSEIINQLYEKLENKGRLNKLVLKNIKVIDKDSDSTFKPKDIESSDDDYEDVPEPIIEEKKKKPSKKRSEKISAPIHSIVPIQSNQNTQFHQILPTNSIQTLPTNSIQRLPTNSIQTNSLPVYTFPTPPQHQQVLWNHVFRNQIQNIPNGNMKITPSTFQKLSSLPIQKLPLNQSTINLDIPIPNSLDPLDRFDLITPIIESPQKIISKQTNELQVDFNKFYNKIQEWKNSKESTLEKVDSVIINEDQINSNIEILKKVDQLHKEYIEKLKKK